MYVHICTLYTHTHTCINTHNFRLLPNVLCTYFSELVRGRKDTRKSFHRQQISLSQCFAKRNPLLYLKSSIPSLSFLTWDLVPHCLFCTIISELTSLSVMLSIKGHGTCYSQNKLWTQIYEAWNTYTEECNVVTILTQSFVTLKWIFCSWKWLGCKCSLLPESKGWWAFNQLPGDLKVSW